MTRRLRLLPLLLAALIAAVVLPAAGGAAEPERQIAPVPTEPGQTVVREWTGTIEPGTNQSSNCDQPLGDSPNDVHTLDVQVPPGTYDRVRVTFEFKIEWDDADNDEILTVINPAIPEGSDEDEDEGDNREVGSSDGGEPVEIVTATNLAPAAYEALSCAFFALSSQDYKGTLTMKAEPAETAAKPLPAAPANGLDFTATVPADPQRRETEPIIEIDDNGNAYTCGPAGVPGTEFLQVSTDGGDQFNPLGEGPQYRPTALPGGGDCSLATSPFANPDGQFPLALTGLGPLTNFVTGASSDTGRTIVSGNSNSIPGVDRQWTAFVNPETVLLSYNQIAPLRQVVVQRSTDRGRTYGTLSTPATPVNALFPGPMRTMDAKFNPVDPTKRVAYFGFDDFNENVYLAVSFDDGRSWSNCLAAKQGGESTLFVTSDNDRDGNIFLSYGEDTGYANFVTALTVDKLKDCAFKVNTTRGVQREFPKPEDGPAFTKPVRVDREGVNTSVFPWIAAGGEAGKVAVAFYGTATDGNPDLATFKGAWNVYVNQSLNLLKKNADGRFVENPDATFSQVKATTHPFHYDSICLGGTGCLASGGDRSLADFFAIDFNPKTGKLQSAYNQSFKKPDDPGGRLGLTAVLTQRAGPSLGGGDVRSDPRPVLRDASEDPAEDALTDYSTLAPTPRVSRNEPAMDFRSVTTGPEIDPETGARVPNGGVTVTMKLADLSDGALRAALAGPSTDRSSRSLVYLFRFFNGYLTSSASARFDGSQFTFGFDDYRTAGITECPGSCQVYRGDQPIKGKVDQAAGTIVLSIPRDKLRALSGPEGPGERPAEVPATEGSRFYDGTAFSLGNTMSANQSRQSFLLRFDNTPSMDFLLGGVPKTDTQPPENGSGNGNGNGPSNAPAPTRTPTVTPPTRPEELDPCKVAAGFNVSVRPTAKGARLGFTRAAGIGPVTVDVFQSSLGRRVIGERLVARFSARTGAVRWNGRANRGGRRVRDGYLFVRFRAAKGASRVTDRIPLRRVGGRITVRPRFATRETCRVLRSAKLERPVFGGRTSTPLRVALRPLRGGPIRVEVRRGSRLVRTLRSGSVSGDRTLRLTLRAAGLARGDYRVRILSGSGNARRTIVLTARRL